MEKLKFEFNLEELEQLSRICISAIMYEDYDTKDYYKALDFFAIFIRARDELEKNMLGGVINGNI